jgi:putative DNA primase/helicase
MNYLDYSNPLSLADKYLQNKSAKNERMIWHNGTFYKFDSRKYEPVSGDEVRSELYPFFQNLFERNVLAKPPKKKSIDEILDAIKARVLAKSEIIPFWLNKKTEKIEPTNLLNVANGLIELSSRKKLPHTNNYFSINSTNLEFNSNLHSPSQWLKFLNTIWADDLESIMCLQEWFGYLLSTKTNFQKALMIIGPKRAGKGTIIRVLQELIGKDSITNPTFGNLSNQFGLTSLIGKRLAVITDARLSGKTDISSVVEVLLRVSGEDSISIPRKYLSDWQGKLGTRFLICTNEIPMLFDSSNAVSSRFIILKLTKSFLGEEDPELTEKLQVELPAILNWSLEGLQRLTERGFFIQPPSANETLELFNEIGSPIDSFISDKCEIAVGAEITSKRLFNLWIEWAHGQNITHMGNAQMFGRNLAAARPEIRKRQLTEGGHKRRYYVGIREKFEFEQSRDFLIISK